MAKIDIEIEPGFEPGSSQFWSDSYQLSHWSYSIEAEVIHSSTLRLDLSYLTRISTQVLFAGASELYGNQQYRNFSGFPSCFCHL